MANELLLLKSPLIEKTYGGTAIAERFGFEGYENKVVGEYWAISAHDNGPSVVVGGDYDGLTLKEVYSNHRELFANSTNERFPLLVKVNEIARSPSVQVHPDDEYALLHENDLGKAEFCLYIDVAPGAVLIRGHNAKTREELREMIEQGRWDELLRRKPMLPNDALVTPPGTIHGIEGGMLVAEVQQSSDVTYRLFDYDNTDSEGNPRELHIDKAIEVATVPYVEPENEVIDNWEDGLRTIVYVDGEHFKVSRLILREQTRVENEKYSLCLVLSGAGRVVAGGQVRDIRAGDGFVVTSESKDFVLMGELDVLISEPPTE